MVLIGSCFAENIGEKFEYFKFQNTINPFGIIFNPISIEKIVARCVHQMAFTETDIFFHNDLWHCFEVHSELSHPDKHIFLDKLNQIRVDFYHQILELSQVLITYGTSWVYRNTENNQIVANCHKVPQKAFVKELLSVENLALSIQNTITLIREVNPNCQFIFTISPVRHTKDGFVENTRSKAHLITAIHNVIDVRASSEGYFPSYEIMMDELRDYRFYAADMLHPNQMAIDYIWERFAETYFTADCTAIMEEVDSIQKGENHRPFNPNTEQHQKFLVHLNQKKLSLTERFPKINF
jgi:hypothetical protein